MRIAIRAGLVAGVLLALVACKPSGKTEAPATSPAVEPAAKAEPAMAPGESTVEVSGARVTVVCRETARGLLLEKLSRAADFELSGELDARPLTLELRDQPLEHVLAALLIDLPYRAQWRVDGAEPGHALEKLELGRPEAAALAKALEPERKKARGDAIREKLRAMREGRVTEEQRAELDARREEKARSQADLLEQLRSSTPDMRIEAVQGIDPEGPALVSLVALLGDDPDSRVRGAVAEQLGNADGYAAVDALVKALDDPDPTVVLKALDSLQFVGDETLAPLLKSKSLTHPDAKVREASAEAADFVQ